MRKSPHVSVVQSQIILVKDITTLSRNPRYRPRLLPVIFYQKTQRSGYQGSALPNCSLPGLRWKVNTSGTFSIKALPDSRG